MPTDTPSGSGRRPKLMLVHAPLGGGHGAAARAIARAAAADGVDSVVVNAYDYCTGFIGKLHVWLYFQIASRFPNFYNWIYNSWQGRHDAPMEKLRRLWDRMLGRPLVRLVREIQPTAIVCTHYYPQVVLAAERRLGKLDVPVYVVIPDYGVHDVWVEHGTDGYFVASDGARRGLLRRGVPEDRIHVTGIPVDSTFGEGRAVWPAARRTVLVMAGGSGVGPIARVTAALASVPNVRAVVVCGRNERLKKKVEAIARVRSMDATVLGYTNEVPRLMRECDIVITKPGGLSTAEAFAAGRPILFCGSGGGQETVNLEEAIAGGGALSAATPDDVGPILRDLYDDPRAMQRLHNAALSFGHPGAARAVVHKTIPSAARLRAVA